jgi:hypothetical protein
VHRMHSTRSIVCLAALAVGLTACGGGGESADTTPATATTSPPTTERPTTTTSTTAPTTVAPTTEPPTTAAPDTAPTTTEPAADAVELVAESGFLTMSVAPGWTGEVYTTETGRTYEEAEGLPWEASTDSAVELAVITRGETTIGIFRETRTGLAPDVFDWDHAWTDLLGIRSNVDVTVEWGGGRGESTRGRIGDDYARHESVQVGDQLVGVLAITPDQPTEELDAEVTAMLETIEIDPSALPPLAHALDTTATVGAELTGSTPFSVSVLVPPFWTSSPDIEASWSDSIAEATDPDGAVGYIEYVAQPTADGTLDEIMFDELDEFGYDWLDVDPVITSIGYDDLDGAAEAMVAWEGSPGEAVAAIVTLSDETAAVIVYIWTPGDPDLLGAMIDSIIVTESAWTAD